MSRWSRRRRNDASPTPDPAEERLRSTREAYDNALAEAGVVLFQQVDVGVDGYHVSNSLAAVLGWNPTTLSTPGTLRSLVHPDDLDTFAALLPSTERPSHDPVDDSPTTEPTGAADGDPPEASATLTPAGPAGASTVIDLTDAPSGPLTHPPTRPWARPEPTVRFQTADGQWCPLRVRLGDPAARPDLPQSVARGCFIEAREQRDVGTGVERMAEVVELDPAGSLILEFVDPADPHSLVIRAANRAAQDLLNLDRAVIDGTSIEAVLGQTSSQLVRSALFDVAHTGNPMTAERLVFAELPGIQVDLRVQRLRDGTLAMTIEDVSEIVAIEQRLRQQASHDALTSLPNRSLFEERLASATAAVAEDRRVGLIVIDVVRLRDLNESLGLHLGDQLLIEIGRRLVREVRGSAAVSRIGGDEFAILTMPMAADSEILERAEAVRSVLDRPFDIGGELVHCQVNIGVAIAPTHADDARSLMRAAYTALDQGRAEDHRVAVFEHTTEPTSIRSISLLSDLRVGLANHDLEMRYQPIVDLRTGRVCKVEASLHWDSDERGDHAQLGLLDLAERSGLVQPLTRWVLGDSATAAATLGSGHSPITVSTNLSLRNLSDPDMTAFVAMLIRSGELPTDRVEIELDETDLMDDPTSTQEVLRHLSEFGLEFVIDRFGTGYTSVATVRSLPVNGLKIDRSFISDLGEDAADAAIVASTIELAHEMGLRVNADGVTSAATLARLAEMGCDLAQGPHLCEPLPFDALERQIAELEYAVRGWIGTPDSSAV